VLVVLVEAENAQVPANDALIEDASGELAKAILLQRNQVMLADLGNCRNVFQRYAAGRPLHAQIFTKASHR
jgi:hypothetical protein